MLKFLLLDRENDTINKLYHYRKYVIILIFSKERKFFYDEQKEQCIKGGF